jgi:hypothetical protein
MIFHHILSNSFSRQLKQYQVGKTAIGYYKKYEGDHQDFHDLAQHYKLHKPLDMSRNNEFSHRIRAFSRAKNPSGPALMFCIGGGLF